MHPDMILTFLTFLTLLNKYRFFIYFMTCVAENWHAFLNFGMEEHLKSLRKYTKAYSLQY